MGAFETKTIIRANSSLIPKMAETICKVFEFDGFTTQAAPMSSSGYDISVVKGGKFKAILGMQSALKIKLVPRDNEYISFYAGVGVFGKEMIPTAIALVVAWPILIPQIWGLIQQSGLDNRALSVCYAVVDGMDDRQIIEQRLTPGPSVKRFSASKFRPNQFASSTSMKHFCPHCGKEIDADSMFCPRCGKQQ